MLSHFKKQGDQISSDTAEMQQCILAQAHTHNPSLPLCNLFFFFVPGDMVTFESYINMGHGYSNTYRIRALCAFCRVT